MDSVALRACNTFQMHHLIYFCAECSRCRSARDKKPRVKVRCFQVGFAPTISHRIATFDKKSKSRVTSYCFCELISVFKSQKALQAQNQSTLQLYRIVGKEWRQKMYTGVMYLGSSIRLKNLLLSSASKEQKAAFVFAYVYHNTVAV